MTQVFQLASHHAAVQPSPFRQLSAKYRVYTGMVYVQVGPDGLSRDLGKHMMFRKEGIRKGS